ncbi:HAD-IA family hydrolase [Pseudobacteriovorax antillogorgiicola]|uniref:Putative hydrolase of the HAD superfamily n=1 Tax=Pseudobacteriovorax antillogorgiicola TaxID=1513793 RepID=A0A1Y6BQI8_9BACT|nr:HAD-IA family hydrolase [Pseudobacteriovorax antillogorgiicola]TCS53714.1 putative hydrolase of the HAD superfamily [Pseudobacteriovorax antillogorgiicola]SMF22908.1 putative hydrolase of the HAD superfamily [Pseudobacteriovorax antillogorgiicola]
MDRSKLKAILCDLDGVIRIHPNIAGSIEQKYGLPTGSIFSTAFEPGLLKQAITGKISDIQWRQAIFKNLSKKFPKQDTKSALESWYEPSSYVDIEALNYILSISPNALLVLVTNATSRLKEDLRALSIIDKFDIIVNSSQIGFIKPDTEIFSHSLELAKCKPEDALFIDDKIENTDAAAKFGLFAHHYTSLVNLKSYISVNAAKYPTSSN